jgi:hypothetical protein
MGCEGVAWIQLDLEGVHWQACVNTVMKFRVPLKREISSPVKELSSAVGSQSTIIFNSLHAITKWNSFCASTFTW